MGAPFEPVDLPSPRGILRRAPRRADGGIQVLQLLRPERTRTQDIVVGDWRPKTVPPAQLEPAVRAHLDQIVPEELAGLQSFRAKK